MMTMDSAIEMEQGAPNIYTFGECLAVCIRNVCGNASDASDSEQWRVHCSVTGEIGGENDELFKEISLINDTKLVYKVTSLSLSSRLQYVLKYSRMPNGPSQYSQRPSFWST